MIDSWQFHEMIFKLKRNAIGCFLKRFFFNVRYQKKRDFDTLKNLLVCKTRG